MKLMFGKRMTAGALALTMLLTTLLTTLSTAMVAVAADSYYIDFDGVEGGNNRMTSIVEGGSINVKASIPPNHNFDINEPFKIIDKDGNDMGGLFSITSGSGYYTLLAKDGAATGIANTPTDPSESGPGFSKSYTLKPQMQAVLSQGTGTAAVLVPKKDADGNLVTPPAFDTKHYSAENEVVSGNVTVLAPSWVTFSVDSGETDLQAPTFGTVTDAGGTFTDYLGKQIQVIGGSYKRTGSTSEMVVGFVGGNIATQFRISVTMGTGEYLTSNSSITLRYDLQEINELSLTIVTPQAVLDDVATGITTNPTNPQVTGMGKPYVQLNTGDSLYAIMTRDLQLLQQVRLYNEKPEQPRTSVKWEWQPDDPADTTRVEIEQGKGVQKQAKITAGDKDSSSKLLAHLTYTLYKPYTKPDGTTITELAYNKVVELPVTIVGNGSQPSLDPISQTQWVPDAANPDGGIAKEWPLVSLPQNTPFYMDRYNKNVTPEPYEIKANFKFGASLGRASKMRVTASGPTPDAMELYIDSNLPYSYGTEVANPSVTGTGQKTIRFVPVKGGQVTLTFEYWYTVGGQEVLAPKQLTYTFIIHDTTPLDFAELSGVNIVSAKLAAAGSDPDIAAAYPSGRITFPFNKDSYLYDAITVPNIVDEIEVTPSIPSGKNIDPIIKVSVSGAPGPMPTQDLMAEGYPNPGGLPSSITIPLTVDGPRTITFTLTAESGRVQQYLIPVNRQPPDTDSTLKSLSVKNEKGEQLLPAFLPNQNSYTFEVPYATRWVQVEAKANSVWRDKIEFIPSLVPYSGTNNWVKLTYPGDPFPGGFTGNKTTTFKTQVTAQNPSYKSTYTVSISRKDPSTNNAASALSVRDAKGKELAFEDNVKFDKDTKRYRLRIPYSCEQMSVAVLPDDKVAQEVTATVTGAAMLTGVYDGSTNPVVLELNTPVTGATEKKFELTVAVRSEKGELTTPPYVVEVTRNDPDRDSMLSSLVLQDQNGTPLSVFSFNPQTTDYSITVPFKVDTAVTIPTPRSPLAYTMVNGTRIDEYTKSVAVELRVGQARTIKVECYPEDRAAEPRVYNITVTRAAASTDARLKSLVVGGGEKFTPNFAADKTLYSVEIPEGTAGITFTAVPAIEASTLMINGAATPSGTASALYSPLEANSQVDIVVTAEDGKTTMTYTVKVVNRNLIPKSSNADLVSLSINYGDMSPRFKPAITEYEVAVKDNTRSVDILPVAQEGATLKVFAGTKQLGDYNNNYSSALVDGENTFKIEVTAEDTTVPTRTYTVTVFLKDEEKQGSYKPITSEMVDFEKEGNEIIVDISSYAVVAADVFNLLRDEYPEKTIIFEGNDYSLSIRGKDIATMVPHEQLFDLAMTFTSPLEDEIWDIIFEEPRNTKVEPVFVHFTHHGVLPGPMMLTLSLGRQYRSQSASWYYYNEERERIDLYGGVKTNSRGTFSVKLTHMSTYLYSKYTIVGAENKTGEMGNIGSITGSGTTGKQNPNTGAK